MDGRRPSVRFVEPSTSETLFSAPGDEEEHVGSNGEAAVPSSSSTRPEYGLKMTPSSREAEFDADDSDIDEGEVDQVPVSPSRRLPLIDQIPFVSNARQSFGDIGAHDLRESVRRAIDSEELPDWLRRGAGILDSTWNMSNSILGAGVVGLPYSLKASGCLTGLGLLVGIALLTDWTIRLIVLNAKLSGRNTYIDIMDHCFGSNGRAAVSIFQGAFAFGGMCAFIVSTPLWPFSLIFKPSTDKFDY